MSFLEELQKKKKRLKATETIVKTAGGDVFLEKKSDDGEVSCERIASDTGYVVDLKPDLEVASVLPGLFMGSQDVTQDVELLKKHNIRHILSIGVQVCKQPGVNYTFIEALDLPEFDMLPVFVQSSKVINKVRNAGRSVFVHCNAGVSRSASVIVAYLMQHKKLYYKQALDFLKSARSCVKPNEGFVKQLKLLESELFCT